MGASLLALAKSIYYTRYLKKCFTQIYRDLYGDPISIKRFIIAYPLKYLFV